VCESQYLQMTSFVEGNTTVAPDGAHYCSKRYAFSDKVTK